MNYLEVAAMYDKYFDEEWNMLQMPRVGNLYHTTLPLGVMVHATRTNICYALTLLASKDSSNIERANKVIEAVLATQAVDPYNRTYGIFPWYADEPVEKMSPPDWNWADFIGATLCHILKDYKSLLSKELSQKVEIALERCCYSIFRRNVQPGYTNIALMGAVVCGCGGEILQHNTFIDYAQRRLESFFDYTQNTGSLSEINSPTYTFVAIHEIERALQLCENKKIIEIASKIHYYVWEQLGQRFHVATGELAGPHSRAYNDFLRTATIDFLNQTANTNLICHVNNDDREVDSLPELFQGLTYLKCPENLQHYFINKTEQERYIYRQRYHVNIDNEAKNKYATTYIKGDLSLGSFTSETFWEQRHNLLGYWLGDNKEIIMLKLNAYKDNGRFSSLGLWSDQDRNKVLCSIGAFSNLGDYHINLDRAPDGCYKCKKMSVKLELSGSKIEAKELDENNLMLTAGAYSVILTHGESYFNNQKVEWNIVDTANGKDIEIVLYQGEEASICFDTELECHIPFAIEIITKEDAIQLEKISQNKESLQWKNIKLTAPILSELYI